MILNRRIMLIVAALLLGYCGWASPANQKIPMWGQAVGMRGGVDNVILVNPGELPIHWTAPGDDGSTGTAHHYVIKYSSAMITESNWDLATPAANPPMPLPAGSAQSFALAGLEAGHHYYVAIKAYDEAGNVSLLSNIVSRYAGGIIVPALIGADIDSVSGSAIVYARPVESGLPVFYQFGLDSTISFTNPIIDVGMMADSTVSSTYGSLRHSTRYYWRCRAVASDHSDSSLWSAPDSFYVGAYDDVSPSVTVTSPNGGEIWNWGSAHDITWNDSDNVGVSAHQIEYSTNNGANWVLIRDWTSGDPRTFAWTVPNTLSSQCRVRVSVRDAANNVGSDISNADFTIGAAQALTVMVTSPNGGEAWEVSSVHNITWTDSDSTGVISHQLEYSIDAGIYWILIRDWTSGNPRAFAWTVPNTASAQCRVRVSCRDGAGAVSSDESDGDFAINDSQAPTMTVISPNGRERWDEMSIHNIMWADSDNVGIVSHRLEYSTNNGSSWILILDWTSADPHTYSWTVPQTPSRSGRVRVSCRDAAGNIASDISNRAFTIRDITRPRVNVIFPNGGDVLEAGRDTSIVWQASDTVGVDSFMIEFTLDAGQHWQIITSWAGGNPESYPWAVPNDLTDLCLLRVSCMDADSNTSADTSNSNCIIRDTIAPLVTIITPAAGDTVGGDSIYVFWVAEDNGTLFSSSIECSTDNGANWVPVWNGPAVDSGFYAWPDPGFGGSPGIIVSCVDQSQNSGSDTVFFIRTDVAEKAGLFPTQYFLSDAYPNPFNPAGNFEFGLPKTSHVAIEIYDLTGRRIRTLVDEERQAGYYRVTWNAQDAPSGVYFCRILADRFSDTKKMLLLK